MDPLVFRPPAASVSTMLNASARSGTLSSTLKLLHAVIRRRFAFVNRVAIALYDSYSNKLKNYVSSNEKEEDPLAGYEFPLSQALSLLESIVKGPRVVNDLSVFSSGRHDHTRKIREHGYQASYTIPLVFDESFCGFIFLNSYEAGCFTDAVIEELDIYCHMIESTIEKDIGRIKILNGALQTAAELLRFGHEPVSDRMQRMSRLSRLVAEEMMHAGKYKSNDEMLENLSRFAAFHDIGKIAMPQSFLSKPEILTKQEYAVLTTHTEAGLKIVDSIISNFGLQTMKGIEMLRNIVLSHHERMDGSGYPHRLRGKRIPVEARIVAVVDIYDALTSDRPHRKAMSSQEAFEILEKQSKKLDPDCLEALVKQKDKVESDL